VFREEIGVLTSLPLLRNVVEDLEAARNNGGSSLTLYFTKESHIHTLVNLVLQSGLPIANRRIPELDYCVSTVHQNGILIYNSLTSRT
jgi:inositol hexakisphosphate/diphosphoinositol-pentakisphosphate kinase